VTRVQRNLQTPAANRVVVYRLKDRRAVHLEGFGPAFPDGAIGVPPGIAGRPALVASPQFLEAVREEEAAVAVDEFERVPLARVVAGAQDQASARAPVLHRHLHGRGQDDAEVPDLAPHRPQAGNRDAR